MISPLTSTKIFSAMGGALASIIGCLPQDDNTSATNRIILKDKYFFK
jgi:hypothetical protein